MSNDDGTGLVRAFIASAILFAIAMGLVSITQAQERYPAPYYYYSRELDDIISVFGRELGHDFESLVEIRTRQDLTGSGEERGRGAIRLYDTIGSVGEPEGRTMEIGFYAYGGGIFTSSLFEMWVDGLSVRNYDETASFIEARDGPDSAGLRIRHDSTYGYVTTTGAASTGVRICPNETCSWSALQSGGDLSGDATNGGDIVVNKTGKGIKLKEATNGRLQSCTLSGGACTMANTTVTAATKVFCFSQADGGTPGWLRTSAKSVGTSYTVTSSSGADTSTIACILIEPS